MKKNILKNNGVQSLLASLVCVILGLLIGYIVLLFINPNGAWEAMMTVVKNFLTYSKPEAQLKNFGNTLVKTAPLLMCALSVLFAYKVGLFNIGAAGQYCVGAALSLYAALGLGWSWLPCLLLAFLGLSSFVGFTRFASVIQVVTGLGIILAYNLSRRRVGKSELVGVFGSLPFQIIGQGCRKPAYMAAPAGLLTDYVTQIQARCPAAGTAGTTFLRCTAW